MRKLATVVMLAALAVVLAAAPASAHARLLESNPSDRQRLTSAPHEVTLTFSEEVKVDGSSVRVLDGTGNRVDTGEIDHGEDSKQIVAPVHHHGMHEGAHIVSFRIISADSHVISGSLQFFVGSGEAISSAELDRLVGFNDKPYQIAAAFFRWNIYGASLIAIGGVFFVLLVHDKAMDDRRRLARRIYLAALSGAITSAAGIGLQAAIVTGKGASAFWDWKSINLVLGDAYGTAALMRFAGFLMIAIFTKVAWRQAGLAVGSTGITLTASSFLFTGHAAAASPRFFVAFSDFAHIVTASIWLGGLVMLGIALRWRRHADDPVAAGKLVGRFSLMASVSLVILTLAGFARTWTEVRYFDALFSTTYGRVLLVKLLFVSFVAAIGFYNNRRLVPLLVREQSLEAWTRLRRTVLMESFGIAVVLGATAVLVNITPAVTAVAGPTVRPFELTVPYEDGDVMQVLIKIDPGSASDPLGNQFHVSFTDERGNPVAYPPSRAIRLKLELPGIGMEPLERTPPEVDVGQFLLDGNEFSVAGDWSVSIVIPTGDEKQKTIKITVPIKQ